MASGGDVDELIAQFKKWNAVSKPKDPNKMTNQAWGKCVQDCIGKDTTTKQRMDSSVWPYVADKATKTLDLTNKAKVNELMDRVAKVYKEIKKSDKSEGDIRSTLCSNICSASPGVKATVSEGDIRATLCSNICQASHGVKATKQSATGGVDRMTDASKYTGAHKERFDESGKGKGAAGRVDQVDTSGYVGNYKGEGSYSKK